MSTTTNIQIDVPPNFVQALDKVVDYLYEEEAIDYLSQDEPPDHIFLSVQLLSTWLIDKTRKVV